MSRVPLPISVAHGIASCATLGPGRRAVVWVQGCRRACPGCIAGPILGPGGEVTQTDVLAQRLLSYPDIDGVTWSGGEPFEQAEAVFDVCLRLRRARDLSLMAYSGFRFEELRESSDPWVRRLLALLDILVDGPFEVAKTGSHLWRGSRNQRVLLLTGRHREVAARPDVSAGVELHVRPDGAVFWAGVPEPGFEARLQRQLRDHAIDLSRAEGVWS